MTIRSASASQDKETTEAQYSSQGHEHKETTEAWPGGQHQPEQGKRKSQGHQNRETPKA
jgi:hypothetical protein